MTRTRRIEQTNARVFRLGVLRAIGLSLALVACGEPPAGDEAAGLVPSDCGDSGQRFVASLSGTSEAGMFILEIEHAEPAPTHGVDGSWTMQLRDAVGNDVSGASLRVKPWMAEHNHASLKTCLVEDLGTGRYLAQPVHLQMPGLWQVRVEIATLDAPADRVLFELCVD